jgi:hypothetical protein
MIPKKAAQTLAFTISLGVLTLLVAKFSNGLHFNKVLPMASALIFAGIAAALSLVQKGKQVDQDCDEREMYIAEKSMKFTFYITAYAIFAVWAFKVAKTGTFLNETTILLYIFLGSYLLAYGINKLRH